MAVSSRTFGVEIECTYGGLPTKLSDVYERMAWGEREPMRIAARKEIAANGDLKRWASNIGIDGSGIEIRSPVLKGEEGIEELAAMFNFLIEKGSSVTNQDGMHVHHGASEFDKDWRLLYHACSSWGHWTPQIHTMVARRRRNGGMCSDSFNKPEVMKQLEGVCLVDDQGESERIYKEYQKALAKYFSGHGRGGQQPVPPKKLAVTRHPALLGGRGAFNISNLQTDKKTIEIRLAEGMMDVGCAVAWVKFGQRFLDHVDETEGSIEGKPKTLDTLLSAIKLDEDAVTVLKAKAANDGKALVNPAPGLSANGVNFDDREDEAE